MMTQLYEKLIQSQQRAGGSTVGEEQPGKTANKSNLLTLAGVTRKASGLTCGGEKTHLMYVNIITVLWRLLFFYEAKQAPRH